MDDIESWLDITEKDVVRIAIVMYFFQIDITNLNFHKCIDSEQLSIYQIRVIKHYQLS